MDTTTRSPAALVILAGDVLDAAGIDADALAARVDAAHNLDTRDTYGAHYSAALADAARLITRTADRLSGTRVRRVSYRETRITSTVGGNNDTTRALYHLADNLNLALLSVND
jgi:hypothetical protein